MKFKKAFSVILAVAMVITLMPSMAFANTTNSVSGIQTVGKNTEFSRTVELAVKGNPANWVGTVVDNANTTDITSDDVTTYTQEVTLNIDNAKWMYDTKTSARLVADALDDADPAKNAVEVAVKDKTGAENENIDNAEIAYCSPNSVTLTITSKAGKALVDGDVIELTLHLKSSSTIGDITLDIGSIENDITLSNLIIATVVSGSTVATVPDAGTDDLEIITVRNTEQTASDIVIRESSAGVVAADSTHEFTLTLPKEVEWNTKIKDNPEDYISGSMLNSTDAELTATISNNNKRVLTVSFKASVATSARRTLTITPVVNTTKNASEGNLTVILRGTSGDISDASGLIIGTIGETNVTVSVDPDDYSEGTIPALYSGMVYDSSDKDTVAIITLKEKADGDLTVGKYIDFTFDPKVQLSGEVEYTLNGGTPLSGTDNGLETSNVTYGSNRNAFGIKLQNNVGDDGEASELKFYIPITVEAGFNGNDGDIECTVTGSAAGVNDTTVTVATVKTPVEIKSEVSKVRTGIQDQAINDIVITEVEAGALSDSVETDYGITTNSSNPGFDIKLFNHNYKIVDDTTSVSVVGDDILIDLPFDLAKKPTVTVTSGDLEINSTINWSKSENPDKIGITVDASSVKEASVITISDLVVTLDRTAAEGGYDIDVYGAAVVQNSGFAKNQAFADKYTLEDAIQIITPADSDVIENKVDAQFVIGQSSYTNNGTAVSMDAAAYIDGNNRTMVPIRYIANACGVNDDNITWDQATQTAIINGANTVVRVTMGDYTIRTSSSDIYMDTVAVNNNGRIYVPARYIANALGCEVTWDHATQTVGVIK